LFERPQTAQQAVLADLRRRIREGEMHPGDHIVQESLAERYGLSRVPIRDALRVLEGEGLVTHQAHRGYFVTDMSISELLEVYRIRELLENDVLKASLPRLTAEDIERVVAAAVAADEAAGREDLLGLSEANHDFHFILFEAAGRRRTVSLIRQLWDSTAAYRLLSKSAPEHREQMHVEHLAIIAAIKEKRFTEAVKLLSQHRQHTVEALQDLLAAAPRSTPKKAKAGRAPTAMVARPAMLPVIDLEQDPSVLARVW